MFSFDFLQPEYIILLLLIPAAGLFFIWRNLARSAAIRRIGDSDLVAILMAQVSPARRRIKQLLFLLTLTALVIALARPAQGIEVISIPTQGNAIVFVIDVSRSMDAQDMLPSRLERVKFDLLDMLDTLEGDDIGMVLFAGRATPYMPLTYDQTAARIFIQQITTDAITQQGTAIADALQQAVILFDDRTGAKPIVVLMSDGENHEGNALATAQDLAQSGVTLHVIGYGTEAGGLIPIYDTAGNLIEYKTLPGGGLIETKRQTDLLESLTIATGGSYANSEDISPVINALTDRTGSISEQLVTRPVERFGIFLLLAWLTLSLDILMPASRQESL